MKWIISLFSWETILEMLLKIAMNLLKQYVLDSDLSTKAKRLVQTAHVLNETLGVKWAKESKTSVDDNMVLEIDKLCNEIAIKFQFELYKGKPAGSNVADKLRR